MMLYLRTHSFQVSILLILTLGCFFRLYKFNTVPFGLPHDGALEAVEAIELSQKPLPYRPYSFIGWQGESLFRYFLALLIKIFGPTIFTIKLGSTMFSLFTLFVFYLLGYQLFPTIKKRLIVVLSLFFLAVSGWHITMGKTVWRVITLPFFESLLLFFWLKFLKRPRLGIGIVSGFFLALTLSTYNSARVIPLILVAWGFIFFFHHQLPITKRLVVSFFTFSIAGTFFLLPLLSFAVHHPQIFNSRANYLFIGNQIKQRHSLYPLWDNFRRTTLMFTVRAGGDDFFVHEPLLDSPASLLFVIGLICALLQIKKVNYQLILSGLIMSLIPGLITSPNGNRGFGALPFVYLLVGVGAYYTVQIFAKMFSHSKNANIIASGFLIFWSLYSLYFIYFGSHRRDIFGFYPETTIVGNYMRQNLNDTDFYLTDNFPRDTLTFLTYTGGNPYQKHYTWLEKNTDLLKVTPRPDRQTTLIMLPFAVNQLIIQKLQKQYPSGTFQELKYHSESKSQVAAWIFKVPSQ